MSENNPKKQSGEDELVLKKVEQVLSQTNPKLKNMPPAEKLAMARAVISISKTHSGPLPPAELIQDYENIYEGSAKLIFEVFEKQAMHRIKMEDTVITSQQRQSDRGQLYAFIIAVLFLGVAAVCILQGHDVAGGAIGTIDLIALVTVFITGKASQKSNLREKDVKEPTKPVASKKRR